MNINKIKAFALAILAVGAMASCEDAIDVQHTGEAPFVPSTSEKSIVFLSDQFGMTNTDSLLFNEQGSTEFFVNLTEVLGKDAEFAVVYDLAALNKYNMAHGTDYKAMPEALVSIEGTAVVAAGQAKSSAVKVGYKTDAALENLGTYAIPLAVKGNSLADVSADKGEFVFLVKDITRMPNCHKENKNQIVVSCMEVNDANPLHNLCYTLKESGKLVIDQVILFSGNINYNAETGEVYNFNNENVQYLLDNREKYLVPLQQKGMKVILGILCNHDRACCTHLGDEAARKFAKELKAKLEAYELDGVFFDDEYCNRGDYPGFTTYNNFSRLCYECRKAMPNALIQAYAYSGTSSVGPVDGVQPGEFVTQAIQDYGRYYDLSSSYPGLPKSGMIQASSEFARGSIISQSRARQIVTDGYGGTMIFSLNPNNGYVYRFNNITIPFYGEETVQTGSYAKDW